jgi:hypothetical protein
LGIFGTAFGARGANLPAAKGQQIDAYGERAEADGAFLVLGQWAHGKDRVLFLFWVERVLKKSEIRNPKSETKCNFKYSNSSNLTLVSSFVFSMFIVLDLFRISDFGFRLSANDVAH